MEIKIKYPTLPWEVVDTNFGESIGANSRSRIIDADGGLVAELGTGAQDDVARAEYTAGFIVAAANATIR